MLKSVVFLILLNIVGSVYVFGQESEKNFFKDGKFGFFVGLNNNEFVRNEKPQWNSIIKTFSPGINTGLHFRPYSWGVLSSLVQISFTQKGTTELFNIAKIEEKISVRTNLDYGQIEVIPLEFTPFPRKNMSPYISAGLFYSKLINSNVRYQYNEKFNIEDDINHFILDFTPDMNTDIGYSIVAGLKFQNFRLEVRNEFGSKALYLNSNIKNHLNSILLRYSL